MADNPIHKFSQGEVYLWAEQGSSVMLKAITRHGDPVELGVKEVEDLIATLQKLLIEIL